MILPVAARATEELVEDLVIDDHAKFPLTNPSDWVYYQSMTINRFSEHNVTVVAQSKYGPVGDVTADRDKLRIIHSCKNSTIDLEDYYRRYYSAHVMFVILRDKVAQ
jgi:hypothetical protein